MKFKYKAITISGNEQEGKIEVSDQDKAIEILQRHKLTIVYIRPIKEWFLLGKLSSILQRVKTREIVIFSKELSIMLSANIPLVEALSIQYQQEENPYFKEQIFIIANKVDDGMPFFSALAGCPKIFSDFYVNVVKAGEASGNLQESFIHLADCLEGQHYLTEKVKNALMYPAFIISGFIVVGVTMMVFVVPQLVSVFEGSGQELPITTKLLIATTNFMQSYIVILLPLAAVAFFAFKNYIKTPEGKGRWDKFILKIPGIKTILSKVYMARFTGNLSMLITSGIPIMDSLKMSGDIVGNDVYKKIIYNSVDEVKIGGSIAYVFERSEQIPVIVSRMMRIGEKTGKLDVILKDIAGFYTKEVDIALDGMTSLIEPLLIFVLGAGVAILVSAILLPIYQMTETF